MSAFIHNAPEVSSVNTIEPMTEKKLLWPNSEIASYLFKKLSDEQAIAKINSAILRSTQPASMSPIQYEQDMYVTSCKVAGAYDETTLNYIFITGGDSTVCQRLREYWPAHPHPEENDVVS